MCIARPVTGYKELVETCRERATELAISRLELDRLAGLPSGYSAKLLGKDDAVPRKKGCGPPASRRSSALSVCKSSSLKTTRRLHERSRGVFPVDQANQRFDNKCNSKPAPRITAPTTEPAPASRAHLRVIQGKRRAVNMAERPSDGSGFSPKAPAPPSQAAGPK
jgi:hypothetical protein